MPYGRGHSKADLARGATRDLDGKTYVVTDKDGTKYTVKGHDSARVIAGKTGTIREK